MNRRSSEQVQWARCTAGAVAIAGLLAHTSTIADTGAVQLKPYTTPDQSASVGVPPGWQVAKGEHGVILINGPQGEQIGLGEGIFVRNGAPQAGGGANQLIKGSMPYQASLAQKYVMLFQQAAAAKGEPTPQIHNLSARAIPLATAFAECGVFLGSMSTSTGLQKFETQFCSLRPDSGGIFKLIWNHAIVPDALAAQERATVEAVMHSYRPAPATLKLMMQPLTPQVSVAPRAPSGAVVGGGAGPSYWGQIGADHAAECMDLGVIREEPLWRQPSYCH